ncbi:MAG: hypothetical protein ABI383_11070 [Acidobacteriaceae bacterium]
MISSRFTGPFHRLLLAIFLLTLSAGCAFAQRNELSVTVGGMFSPNTSTNPGVGACSNFDPNCASPFTTSSSVALEGDFAHRILNLHLASLSVEFPIVGVTDRNTQHTSVIPGTLNSGEQFTQIFFTPSVKLKFNLPVISPFVSAGGGFAHFGSVKLVEALPGSSSTTGAFQVGGGVDVGTPIPHIGLRGEAREFYTGESGLSTSRHNVLIGAGVVLRF